MLRRCFAATIVAATLGVPIALARPAAAAPPVFTWTGVDAALGNGNWSSGANWAGGVAPPAGTPIDVVVDSPCSGLNCDRSTNDINGVVVNSFAVANGSLRVETPLSTTSFTLAGGIAVTDGGSLSVVGLTLSGPTTSWALDDGQLAIQAGGGTNVAVSMANGARFAPAVTAISISVTGTDPSAAPADNGTVTFGSSHSPMLLSHVAAEATAGLHAGPLLTDHAAFHLGVDRQLGFPSHDVIFSDLTVQGSVALDAATTITEDVIWADRSAPPFPGVSELRASAIRATGTLALGSAALHLDLGGTCIPIGPTTTVASASPGGLSGTFAGLPDNAVLVADDAPASCPGGQTKHLRIHYDTAAGTATATAVQYPPLVPQISMGSTQNPTVPGRAVTIVAALFPYPADGGTVSFADNGAPIAGCTAQPVSPVNGEAKCTQTYAAPGTHPITATYSGTATVPPAGPSTVLSQAVVPAPTATITTPSGLAQRGDVIEGTASDVGGPGLYAVVLYYQSLSGGPSGAVLATCDDCGFGKTSSHWSFTTPLDGIPGVYAFVVQPFDIVYNPGPASNVIYQIIS